MIVSIYESTTTANEVAAAHFGRRLSHPSTRTVMVAAGNTPLDLYQRISAQGLTLPHLRVFALDEYVGVPLEEPRNCANLLRHHVAQGWGLKPDQFLTVSSVAAEAERSVKQHESAIEAAGGLDLLVLGLGQNGHLGFNEPGSSPDCGARVLPLDPISVEANRKWFHGRFAPDQGVTVGMKTILGAREIFLLAFGAHKTQAVREMIRDSVSDRCPASFLQTHPRVKVFLDTAAAADLLTVS